MGEESRGDVLVPNREVLNGAKVLKKTRQSCSNFDGLRTDALRRSPMHRRTNTQEGQVVCLESFHRVPW